MTIANIYFKDIIEKLTPDKTGIVIDTNIDTNNIVIESIVFEPPYTIINWEDKTKTITYCDKHDNYDMVTGTTLCILKKIVGNTIVNKVLTDIYNLQEKIDKKPNKKKWTIDYRDKDNIPKPKYKFDMYFKHDGNHKYWIAASTELNGCVAQGETMAEAIKELVLNEIDWINTAKKYGMPIPKPKSKK